MKRPAKPRIKKENLQWKWNRSKASWEPYYRATWTEGDKQREKFKLLKWQGNPQILDDQYWKIRSQGIPSGKVIEEKTWHHLITLWRADPKVQMKLADSTKKSYRRDMELILAKNAKMPVAGTTRQMVQAVHESLHESTRKADRLIGTIGNLWNYAKFKKHWDLGENPAEGIERYGKQREFKPWPEWMIRKLDTAPQEVQIAAFLILNTGQRPSAAIGMQFDQFNGESMSLTDEKGDLIFDVFCPPAVRDYVENIPRKGAHLLAKNLRACLTYHAIEHKFRAWRKDLGDNAKEFTLHGLRKLAIINLAEAGVTDAQIQSITNQSLETIAYYRRLANRKKLSKAAFEALGQNKNRT